MSAEDMHTIKNPVVVILGASATGKSKLSIELAKKFNGEIISADSMQVYKGLDILTNKVTTEEMQNVPHHLLNVVDRKETYDVVKFKNMALPIVKDVLHRGKIPLIVGGTNYYIESLLWKVLIEKPKESKNGNTISNTEEAQKHDTDDVVGTISPDLRELLLSCDHLELEKKLNNWTNAELHSQLSKIDLQRASRLHPNDRRKVVRSLQVWAQTGAKHSELIENQMAKSSKDEEMSLRSLGGPLRFKNCLCLWIQVSKDILRERIDKRADAMLNLGLREEIDSYNDVVRSETIDNPSAYEKGILQSIGFKEFIEYNKLDPSLRYTEQGDQKFVEGLQRLKTVTNQYANKQLRWINQRFLRPSRRQLPPVYWLNGDLTSPDEWSKNVTSISTEILKAYLSNDLNHPLLNERRVPLSTEAESDLLIRKCEVCDKTMIGSEQYSIHMKSMRHRKMAKRKIDEKLKSTAEVKKSCLDENGAGDNNNYDNGKESKILAKQVTVSQE